MSFNPNSGQNTPNPHPPRLLQQEQLQQQEQFAAAAAARQRQKMAMLPPQFQNLTPQQLQDLKNQPQFQNMLRQYLQRQQMQQQQQQMQQQRMMGPSQVPGIAPNGQLNRNINSQMHPSVNPTVNLNMNPGMDQSMGQGMAIGQGQNIGDASSSFSLPQGPDSSMFKTSMSPLVGAPQMPQMSMAQQQMYNKNMQAAFLQQQQQQQAQNMIQRPQTGQMPQSLAQVQQQIPQQTYMPQNVGQPLPINHVPMNQQMNTQRMGQQPFNQQQMAQQRYSQQQLQRMQQLQHQNTQNMHNSQRSSNATPGLFQNLGPGVIGGMANPQQMMVGASHAAEPEFSQRLHESRSFQIDGPEPQNISQAAAAAAAAAAAVERSQLSGAQGPSGLATASLLGESAIPASFIQAKHESGPRASENAQEKIKLPPNFAPDSLSKVDIKPMSSLTEWSEKLEASGTEVPLDIKLYEELLKKDDAFLRATAQQENMNKELILKMSRDIKSYNVIKQLRMAAIAASAKNQFNNSIWGDGYLGYGNGISNTATQVILPAQNKSFLKVPDVPYTDAEMSDMVKKNIYSLKPRHLIPIRLDFDQERDRFKLRDTFLWDINDETLPLENFVKLLIEDYKFISENHFHIVYQAITEQIKEYKAKPEKCMGEIRVPIKIDLLINNTQFTDQFEWDILNSKESDPEEFATVLCDEMCLPGEFATSIAFSIREQTQLYHKALFLIGYSFDGSPIREDEIKSNLAPPLRIIHGEAESSQSEDFVTTLRNPALLADYSPSMTKLSQLEIEKLDKEMERESRRRRRHFNSENAFSYNENLPNLLMSQGLSRGTASRRSALHSGRGVKTTLPDLSEMPKTFRTPMPSSVLPGGIDLGVPAIFGYNELIINRSQVRNPEFKAPAPPGMVTSFRDTAGSFFVKIRYPRRPN